MSCRSICILDRHLTAGSSSPPGWCHAAAAGQWGLLSLRAPDCSAGTGCSMAAITHLLLALELLPYGTPVAPGPCHRVTPKAMHHEVIPTWSSSWTSAHACTPLSPHSVAHTCTMHTCFAGASPVDVLHGACSTPLPCTAASWPGVGHGLELWIDISRCIAGVGGGPAGPPANLTHQPPSCTPLCPNPQAHGSPAPPTSSVRCSLLTASAVHCLPMHRWPQGARQPPPPPGGRFPCNPHTRLATHHAPCICHLPHPGCAGAGHAPAGQTPAAGDASCAHRPVVGGRGHSGLAVPHMG